MSTLEVADIFRARGPALASRTVRTSASGQLGHRHASAGCGMGGHVLSRLPGL